MIYPHSFPFGTFGVNMIGCFLIGLFWGLTFRSFAENESWKLFLMTGLCGGFTTFSAFTLEGIGLIKEQKTGLFLLYTGGQRDNGFARNIYRHENYPALKDPDAICQLVNF
jgi:CrcB protein